MGTKFTITRGKQELSNRWDGRLRSWLKSTPELETVNKYNSQLQLDGRLKRC